MKAVSLFTLAGFVLSPVFLTAIAAASDEKDIRSAFASTTTEITAMPDAVAIPVEWSFTNHWEFPLMVEKFDEACGCLSGKMNPEDVEAIAPGETGTIRASFTPGAHRGLLRKSLHVRFAGHEGSVELIVEAKIPQTVEFSERELKWDADSRNAAKTLDITSGTGADFTITNLSGLSEEIFTIERETIECGRHYRISIMPADGATAGIHTLLVRTDSKDPRDRVVALFLHLP